MHPADDHGAWLSYFGRPELAAVTVTVTEAGYLRGPDGGLDASRLRSAPTSRRCAATRPPWCALRRPGWSPGWRHAQRAGRGPLALVPCDNLPGNGALARRVTGDLADLVGGGPGRVAGRVRDGRLHRGRPDHAAVTVRPTSGRVAAATGRADRCPVVTEPFAEWVLGGAFPAGRPRWEDAGAVFTDDVTPFEHRKLWLLNGAHSLLAYAGSLRGHVDRRRRHGRRRRAGRGWRSGGSRRRRTWNSPPPTSPPTSQALLDRFGNPRMRHRLGQIAADGSQKLPVRVLPVLRAERAAGRLPPGGIRILAAWLCHLRGLGEPVRDVRAAELVPLARGSWQYAAPRLLGWLDPRLGDDRELAAAVAGLGGELAAAGGMLADPGGQ